MKWYENLCEEDRYVGSDFNAFLDRFKSICAGSEIRAVTFDFFDTIVWRPFRNPTDLFWGLGEELSRRKILTEEFGPGKFMQARIIAERRARARKVRQGIFHEVTLAEIYDEFVGLSPAARKSAAGAEVAHEASFTLPDPTICAAIDFASALGKEILIVSNTYFTREQLAHLVERKTSYAFPIENIYVSSEYGIDKEHGLLPLVLEAHGLGLSEVVHVGDNRWGDVDVPISAGVKALFYPKFSDVYPSVEAREQKARSLMISLDAPEYDLLPQIRRLRLNAIGHEAPLTVSERLGAFVVGPVLAAFAQWLMDELDRRGPAPVLCLTREGLFLSEILQEVAVQSGRSDFISAPFLSSRSIVFSAAFFNFSDEELEAFLFSRRTPFTIRTFCALVEYSHAGEDDFGVSEGNLDFPLIDGMPLTNVLVATMSRHVGLKSAALRWSDLKRGEFKRYVDAFCERHKIDARSGILYVADVGWSGKSQRLLEKVLREIGREVELRGLYMATDASSHIEHMMGLNATGWLYDGGLPKRSALIGLQSKEIIEQVCSSHLGSVRTYDLDGDPVFGRETKSLRQRVDLQRLRNAVRGTVSAHTLHRAMVRDTDLSATLVKPGSYRAAYSGLVAFPEEDEYALFSSWTHEENNLSDNVELLGSAYWKAFASYATPQQFLESSAYWKLPEFRKFRPLLVNSLLLKSADLPSLLAEDAYPYSVESYDGQNREDKEAYFSLDGRAILSTARVCEIECTFRFVNKGSLKLKVDTVLIVAYDNKTRERIESVLMPDFADHPETRESSRYIMAGGEFRVNILKPIRTVAPVSAILCVSRIQ